MGIKEQIDISIKIAVKQMEDRIMQEYEKKQLELQEQLPTLIKNAVKEEIRLRESEGMDQRPSGS